jgi:hypothetical protein
MDCSLDEKNIDFNITDNENEIQTTPKVEQCKFLSYIMQKEDVI